MATEPVKEEQKEEIKESERPDSKESLVEIGDKLFDEKEKNEPAKPEQKPEAKAEKPAAEEEKPSEEKPAEKPEDGYFADETETEEVKEAEPLPTDTQAPNWILEQLPQITVNGRQGDKAVTIQVKRAEDLPRDFEFDNTRDAYIFNQAIADQTQRAYQLVNQLQTQRQQEQNQEFAVKENHDIQQDIAKLQREGELPTFTRGVSVDEDPKAETAREVLDFYNKENVKRLESSQRDGRLFHHLSYEDAYYLWKAQNPAKVGEEQKAEDSERKEITRRQARAGRGASTREVRQTNLPRTANWDQVINAVMGE